ncbi:hypothetical protein [Phycicoccus flavus]|uniref:hypothetical protein n=1 Tax=Phycicoccus flavus TaxID=2502783 RepID=UPI000FEB75D2|nr:hypothetical protein [Phycicoccus flavus]NHA68866.1 hypothetical protein [Phycicoccus flavus]
MDSTSSRPTHLRPSRRSALGVAALAAVGAVALPESALARRAPRAPETVPLPDGIRPEGITSGPGTRYYVGSLADGRIVTGDLLAATSMLLLPGAEGRQLRGLFWDGRSNLVWAAGNVGAEAHVWAVDGSTGAVRYDVVVPGGGFLNDLVVTDTTVWVTDSRVDRLTAIAVGPDGMPTGAAPTYLPLTGEWPGYDGSNLAANGIRELSDGMLLLDHSSAGGLWAVDPGTGVTAAVPVSGGPGITGGDGIELDGNTAYVVRGSGQNEVSVLRLTATADGWTARWRGRAEDETLDVPSTATLAGGWLWAVNARFGVADPGSASYWITRLPAR